MFVGSGFRLFVWALFVFFSVRCLLALAAFFTVVLCLFASLLDVVVLCCVLWRLC